MKQIIRFLNDNDYTDAIRQQALEQLLDGRTSALYTAENKAIGQLKQYCADKLDLQSILSKTENARDHFIIMLLIDLSLYHLYTATAPNQIPEHRTQRYDDAIQWMKDIATGIITANSTNNNNNTPIAISSQPKQRHYY